MKLTGEDVVILWVGKPKPVKFTYRVHRRMDKDMGEWLRTTFKGFAVDYYYSSSNIYFKSAKQETLFLLRWHE